MKKKLILGLIAIGIILISAVYYHTIKDTLKIAKNIDKQYWNLMREIQSAHEKCTFPSTKDLGDSQSFIAHAGGAIIYEGKPTHTPTPKRHCYKVSIMVTHLLS